MLTNNETRSNLPKLACNANSICSTCCAPRRSNRTRALTVLAAENLISLPVVGVRRTWCWAIASHHGKTSRVDAVVVRLSSGLLLFTLGSLLALALLGCTLSLLRLELDLLQTVIRALIVQLCVLGRNLFTSCVTVAATASTKIC
jgi:hypothetical protein